MEAVIGGRGLEGGIRRFIFVNLLSGFRTGCQKGGGDVNRKIKLRPKESLEGRPPERLMELVSKLSIGFEVKEGEEAEPQEYMVIFRGLRFKPDAEIDPEERF